MTKMEAGICQIDLCLNREKETPAIHLTGRPASICRKTDIPLKYVLGVAGGASYKLYEINKEIFDQIGTFKDDDYKSERLIREGGRKLYVSMVDRNVPGFDEVIDREYRKLCTWAEIVSFVGK